MKDMTRDEMLQWFESMKKSFVVDKTQSICGEQILIKEVAMNWIPVTERLPEVDNFDEWNAKHRNSKDVLCYNKEFGMRFGRYHHNAEFWTVNGITSSEGVIVTHWMEIKPPK